MNLTKHAFLWFVLLIFCAFLGLYFVHAPRSTKIDPQALNMYPDFIIDNLDAYKFDDNGNWTHHLHTSKWQHVAADNRHYLSTPYLRAQQPNRSEWQIVADFAQSENGLEVIHFYKHVVLQQNDVELQAPRLMKTEELTYDTNKKIAFSPLEVYFQDAESTAKSTGMRANLVTQQIELLGRTQADFAPQQLKLVSN